MSDFQAFMLFCAVAVVAAAALQILKILDRRRPPRTVPADAPASAPTAAPAKCKDCRFFDLEEGQAAIAAHPDFARAAQHLSPAQMNRKVEYEPCDNPACWTGPGPEAKHLRNPDCDKCHGSGNVAKRELPSLPMRAQWNQFGACMNRRNFEDDTPVLHWHEDSCEHFEKGKIR